MMEPTKPPDRTEIETDEPDEALDIEGFLDGQIPNGPPTPPLNVDIDPTTPKQ